MVPGSSVIGISLKKKVVYEENTVPSAPVKISFKHKIIEGEECKLLRISCVAWDLEKEEWSSEGCYYKPSPSLMESICECYHLTNFGIMFDFTGNSDPDNVFLSWFSIINMSLSTGLIILTEVILFIQNQRR